MESDWSASFALDAISLNAAADLCRQLDGMPLAIEMAAARVPAFGLRGVRDLLGRHLMSLTTAGAAPSRQRTLRSALEWSHSLLTTDEQAAFRRLAPFVGGFTAPLAEAQLSATADSTAPAFDGLDALGSLVDKSLVQASVADPPRYRLLESAREFALESLNHANEVALASAAHAQVMAAHYAEARDDADLLTELEWLEYHVVERDNVGAALRWAVEHADADTVARLLAYRSFIENFTGVLDVGSDSRLRSLGLSRQTKRGVPRRFCGAVTQSSCMAISQRPTSFGRNRWRCTAGAAIGSAYSARCCWRSAACIGPSDEAARFRGFWPK